MGDITLRYKPEEPIDVVDWCNTSVLAYEEASQALEKEADRIYKLENEVDEAGLMEKFRDLLNEKKVKIREQQRLLATTSQGAPPTAEGTPEAVVPLSPKPKKEPKDSQARAPGPSRRGKRKQASPPPEEEDDDSDEFEKMDTEGPGGGGETVARDSEDDRTTDPGSDDDPTASEADEDEAPPPPSRSTRKAAAKPAKGARASARGARQTAQPEEASSSKVDDGKEPPKRELPFASKKKTPAAKTKEPEPAGSETESDDEL
ncbi:unnamed protein product [Parascedosporium putredinis]|uniref:Uncharacterized protein n=1 Tax=Parascedosporium putredinis TaxID=1442378 RepID=A0A9P1GXD7_9PEZI|nr:unnamed protein product [Parascedosporium putredinis]CAI7990488.1 unnamed protein product [Parascedosporium putredinis]